MADVKGMCVWGEMDDRQTDGQKERGEEAQLDSLKATNLPSPQVTVQRRRARTITHEHTLKVTVFKLTR